MNSSPRRFGSLVGLVAAWFVSDGLYHLMLIGSCSIPAGPGEVPCPPLSERYFFYVFFGIVVAMLSIFLGGGWLSFVALFAAVGVGAVRAGLSDAAPQGSGWFFLFGLAFLLTPLLAVVALPFAGLKRLREQRLLSGGAQGTGTVLAVEDTGITINNNPRVRLRFRIEPADGITPPFEATKTATVSRVNLPRPGDRYPVWYDPADPTHWMFAAQPGPAGGPRPPLGRLVELARQGARPTVPPPPDPEPFR